MDAALDDTAPLLGTVIRTGPTPARWWQPIHCEVLEFERGWWKYPGLKVAAIHDLFGLTEVQYYSVVRWALAQPEADRYDRQLVERLRRTRDARAAARSSRRLPNAPAVVVPLPRSPLAARVQPPARLATSPAQLLIFALITDASLVSRPQGVVHLYRGPLTRSGRFVPRDGQTVCRTTTARLTVRDQLQVVRGVYEGAVEVCGTCSTRLAAARQSRVGRVEHTRRKRLADVFNALPAWVVPALARIGDPEWVDEYDHRALALVARVATTRPVEWPEGITHPPARTRPDTRPVLTDDDRAQAEADFDAALDAYETAEKAERKRRWLEREAEIARRGISRVQPTPRRRPA